MRLFIWIFFFFFLNAQEVDMVRGGVPSFGRGQSFGPRHTVANSPFTCFLFLGHLCMEAAT